MKSRFDSHRIQEQKGRFQALKKISIENLPSLISGIARGDQFEIEDAVKDSGEPLKNALFIKLLEFLETSPYICSELPVESADMNVIAGAATGYDNFPIRYRHAIYQGEFLIPEIEHSQDEFWEDMFPG